MSNIKKVFGSAGTGKTTYIIRDIEEKFNLPNGKDFGYFTFTKSQASDFKRRIMERFSISEDEYKELWIGTQHSICYRLLNRQDVIQEGDKVAFCEAINFEYALPKTISFDEFSELIDVEDDAPIGNKAFYLDNMCRMQRRIWSNDELLDLFGGDISSNTMSMFNREWKAWKETNNKIDYADMLEKVLEQKVCPPVSRLYFDEFQDYGKLQYEVYALWRDNAKEIVIAGDDDQAIYGFIGASPDFMLNEKAEKIILKNNYRNTKEIFAAASNLIKQNINRQDKEIVCVNEETGVVSSIDASSDGIPLLTKYIQEGEKTFILTRTNRQYRRICSVFDRLLIPYRCLRTGTPWSEEFLAFLSAIKKISTNKDEKLEPIELHEFISNLPQKDYIYRGRKGLLLKNFTPMSYNELLKVYLKPAPEAQTVLDEYSGNVRVTLATPVEAAMSKLKSERQREIAKRYMELGFESFRKLNVWLGTYHSSKGSECDTVFLVDSLPRKIVDSLNAENIEAERRVYYVAMTRAKTRLIHVYNLFENCHSFIRKEVF